MRGFAGIYIDRMGTSAESPEITKALNCLFDRSSEDAYGGRGIP
jgi:hypothetical protein